jgi:hypothetical protein
MGLSPSTNPPSARPAIVLIDGRAHSWLEPCKCRRKQLEAWRAAHPSPPALFEMKHDSRPAVERTASGRYQEPTLLPPALYFDRRKIAARLASQASPR